ncbi:MULTISPECIES: serine/threonine protein kinase [unclassified Paenibacillus]|uniref:serine/threonine protein kinase n=1 Tax=unclassified Paenibacillus TaxID=185978 RepID=UPI001AE95EAE|nr:serine/threonine-protein kinase [Paenibacillus sp. PvP091]MBP1171121.1 serine/threonine-protein kinase [Paenibacillus sp. PvR098]MBP2442149.1 serine/threonine-protein kinase [Paenibacillus sp. PvP052]
MTTSFELAIPVETRIRGKWNKNQYRVERLLGEGENGKVFLVSRRKQLYALKVGFDPVDHQSEVNALKALSKSSTSFQDMLVEADDFSREGIDYPFCVMRYIKGKSLTEFIKQCGTDWIPLIGLNLLRKLSELHASGFVFGDLKAENMIITGYGEVELIDFGGVTSKGRAVKQFTEVYDRGFWNAGSRTADEGYDLFSFAVLLLQVTDRERKFQGAISILPQNRSVEWLFELLKERPQLAPAAPMLRKALTGRYESSKQMLADWRARSLGDQKVRKKPVKGDWIKLCFAASLILFGTTVYLVWQ